MSESVGSLLTNTRLLSSSLSPSGVRLIASVTIIDQKKALRIFPQLRRTILFNEGTDDRRRGEMNEKRRDSRDE